MRNLIRVLPLLSSILFPACVVGDVDDPDELPELSFTEQGSCIALTGCTPVPPRLPAEATLVLFSEVGFWGDTQTIRLAHPDDRAYQSFANVASAMANRVSSARLTCGSMTAEAVFYDAASQTGASSGIRCEPGQTTSVDLHSRGARGLPGLVPMGDRVVSLGLQAHPAIDVEISLDSPVQTAWEDRMDNLESELGTLLSLVVDVTAEGPVDIRWAGYDRFRIEQRLRISLPGWSRTARLVYVAATTTTPGGTYAFQVVTVFATLEGYQDTMFRRVEPAFLTAAANARSALATGLNSIASGLTGKRAFILPNGSALLFTLGVDQ